MPRPSARVPWRADEPFTVRVGGQRAAGADRAGLRGHDSRRSRAALRGQHAHRRQLAGRMPRGPFVVECAFGPPRLRPGRYRVELKVKQNVRTNYYEPRVKATFVGGGRRRRPGGGGARRAIRHHWRLLTDAGRTTGHPLFLRVAHPRGDRGRDAATCATSRSCAKRPAPARPVLAARVTWTTWSPSTRDRSARRSLSMARRPARGAAASATRACARAGQSNRPAPGVSGRAGARSRGAWRRGFATPSTCARALCVSNLEVPEAPELCQPVTVWSACSTRTARADGVEAVRDLARNASLMLEVADLLPPRGAATSTSGQVRVDFEGPQLGSSRAYLHWYNERSLTSSHEKFGLTIPAVGGYWTVPNVQDSDEYRVHLAVTNLDERPYTSTITLKDDEGHALADDRRAAAERLAVSAAGQAVRGSGGVPATASPACCTSATTTSRRCTTTSSQNQRLGTWRAQHL